MPGYAADLERQPLIAKPAAPLDAGSLPDEDVDYLLADDHDLTVHDTMTYNISWLKGWTVFVVLKNSTWDNSTLWYTMAKLGALSLTVALASYLLMEDTNSLDTLKFSEITTLLNIFLSLMLGFFLSESVKRWSSCVDGFLSLFNSIRNLSMQFHALGVDSDLHDLGVRYGVLSTVFLFNDLKRRNLPQEQQANELARMWKNIRQNSPALQEKGSKRYVLDNEQAILEEIQDCAGQMWLWVASLVGRMSQDGVVPGMPTPTYGRILNICQDAQDGVRQVRTSIYVKLPFIYMHTLATLVHVTNILFAISLGLTLGSATTGIVSYSKAYWKGTTNDMTAIPLQQIQNIMIETLKCSLGPLLYQAFFELGCSISAPFNHPDGAIPVNKMILELERDLADSDRLANNLPSWEKPHFKQ